MMGSETSNAPAAGWHRVPNAVTEAIAEIGATAYAVFGALARHADERGRCWPSLSRLGRLTGFSTRTVRRALRTLESRGMLASESRTDHGRVLTRIYVLMPPQQTPDTGDRSDASDRVGRTLVTGTPDAGDRDGGHWCPEEADTGVRRKKTEKKETQERDKRRGCAAAVAILSAIDTELFHAAWGEWLAYRRQRRLTMSETTLRRQLKNLALWGEAAAVASINTSIDNGWAGLFPPKEGRGGRRGLDCGRGQRHPADSHDQEGRF